MTLRAPSLFLPHGGGPMPLLGDPGHKELIKFLETKARALIVNPRVKAIVVVTAHWETSPGFVVSTTTKNKLLYDYGGFPKEAYDVSFPATGSPEIAARVASVLTAAGLPITTDSKRGWDHGVFVPLKLVLGNEWSIPLVSLSVCADQDPARHFAMGRALSQLRDEGIAIVGSGMSFHNFAVFRRGFALPPGAKAQPENAPFHEALAAACAIENVDARAKAFAGWDKWAGARDSHPVNAAEHFMPLVVTAGAGGEAKGEEILTWQMGLARQGAWVWN
ncbi:Extradiol ring-cleavage dioxygenase, class III enzyme, subunit B [Geranomyces variabilis]|nr:Extradiol ring-cleavage dioxygenase, class III enzyme, subunit B [Geranomyces variabilis]KAJ3141614.1 hypothetical protein HDU90_005957 [Geranomyces variabilis]